MKENILYLFLILLLASCSKVETQNPFSGDWTGKMILTEYNYNPSGYSNASISEIDTIDVRRHAYELNGEIVADQFIKNTPSFVHYFYTNEDHYHLQGQIVDTIVYQNTLCRRERQFDIIGHLQGSAISEEGLALTHIYYKGDTLQIPDICSFSLTRQIN